MRKNQEGQALLELIVFLPLLFTVYAIVTGFANAIYGSINQQKFTRSYFYYRVQNNSTIPRRQGDDVSWKLYGMYFVGWREKTMDEVPLAPCYRISIPIANSSRETCDDTYTSNGSDTPSTQYMRVGTVYGFCGATYVRNNGQSIMAPNQIGLSYAQVTEASSCLIQD